MSFQEKLKELMTERSIRAVDLARTTGLSEAAISDYLKGKKEPRGRQSKEIAKALNVSLDTLWETDFQEENSSTQIKEDRITKGLTQQLAHGEKSQQLKPDFIRKYFALDARGRKAVDDTLEREYRFTINGAQANDTPSPGAQGGEACVSAGRTG